MKLPQKKVKWLGAFFESLYLALPILSILNFLSIMTILYTNVSPSLLKYTPWLTFWVFLGIVAILTLIMVVLTWIFLVPSLWAIRYQQLFNNETRKE